LNKVNSPTFSLRVFSLDFPHQRPQCRISLRSPSSYHAPQDFVVSLAVASGQRFSVLVSFLESFLVEVPRLHSTSPLIPWLLSICMALSPLTPGRATFLLLRVTRATLRFIDSNFIFSVAGSFRAQPFFTGQGPDARFGLRRPANALPSPISGLKTPSLFRLDSFLSIILFLSCFFRDTSMSLFGQCWFYFSLYLLLMALYSMSLPCGCTHKLRLFFTLSPTCDPQTFGPGSRSRPVLTSIGPPLLQSPLRLATSS